MLLTVHAEVDWMTIASYPFEARCHSLLEYRKDFTFFITM